MKKYWKDNIPANVQKGNGRTKKRGMGRHGQWAHLMLLFILLWGCSGPDHDHPAGGEGSYTCPMHPEVVQEGPGTCPVCDMDLVPLHSDGDTTAVSGGLEYLLQSPNHTVVAGIRTVVPVKKTAEAGPEAYGRIMYDTRRAYTIPVRFGGRIEKLYINYNFEPVRKGQKILEIYSPEIVTAQKELLYLLESDPGNKQLIDAARKKLRLLGLTEAQVARLAETRTASYSLPVYSPYSGYIYEQAADPALQGPGAQQQGSRLEIREGMYLSKGEGAFKVINTGRLWAEFTVYPEAVPYVQKGDAVRILPDYNKEMEIQAKVDFVQPYYQGGESFSKVRIYLDNSPNRFIPGQLVTARFSIPDDSTWWVPAASVVDLGTKKVVFVKEGKVFHPRTIGTGRTSEDWTEVVSGLSAGDSIAYNGHFMVDTEGFVKIRNEKR